MSDPAAAAAAKERIPTKKKKKKGLSPLAEGRRCENFPFIPLPQLLPLFWGGKSFLFWNGWIGKGEGGRGRVNN